MACGDKYETLLRTADGRGPQDFSDLPAWSFIAGEYDLVHGVANRIAREVKERWASVQDLQRSASNLEKGGPELKEILDSITGELQSYWEAYAALPGSTWEAPFTSDTALVHQAWDTARQGICVMDRLDQAITLMGGTPPATAVPPQSPGNSWWDGFVAVTIGAGVLVAMGYVIYVGVKRKGAREAIAA